MKKCIHCGKELPDQAVFCPYCETKQTDAKPAQTPRKWRKKAGIAAILAVFILLACFAAHSLQKPKVYDAQGPELQYKDYHVMVRLNGFGDGPIEGEPLTERPCGQTPNMRCRQDCLSLKTETRKMRRKSFGIW